MWRRRRSGAERNSSGRRRKFVGRRAICKRIAQLIEARRDAESVIDPKDVSVDYPGPLAYYLSSTSYPEGLLIVACADALKLTPPTQFFPLSRRMVLYWRGHEDYDDALRLLGSCAYSMTRFRRVGDDPGCTLEIQSGPVLLMGYWSEIYVHEGGGSQIRVSTLASKTPLPAATAETK